MATIKDVAREAGVALSTVSKYINGGNVLEENREKIQNAIDRLGFQVNFHAHAMRSGSSKLVLVMVPQFEDSYCCEIMQTARRKIIENGYIAVLAETRGNPRTEQEILQRAIARQMEGVISLHTDMSAPVYDELQRSGIPLVVIGKTYRKKHSGCVYFDDAEKFTKIFRQIKSLGHYYIGIVGGAVDKARLHSREFAYYLNLFEKAGLNIDERYIYTDDCGEIETGMEAVKYFSTLEKRPTVLVCLNSRLLLGAYAAFMSRGYRVPEDVSLCMLARSSEWDNPLLERFAAVFQPVEEATEQAVGLLMDNIRAKNSGKSVPHAIVRLTTQHRNGESMAPAKDPEISSAERRITGGWQDS